MHPESITIVEVWMASHLSSEFRFNLFVQALDGLVNQSLKPRGFRLSISGEYGTIEIAKRIKSMVIDRLDLAPETVVILRSDNKTSQFQHLKALSQTVTDPDPKLRFFVAMHDDDDISHPSRLKVQVECALKLEAPAVVSCLYTSDPDQLGTERWEPTLDGLVNTPGCLPEFGTLLMDRRIIVEYFEKHYDVDMCRYKPVPPPNPGSEPCPDSIEPQCFYWDWLSMISKVDILFTFRLLYDRHPFDDKNIQPSRFHYFSSDQCLYYYRKHRSTTTDGTKEYPDWGKDMYPYMIPKVFKLC